MYTLLHYLNEIVKFIHHTIIVFLRCIIVVFVLSAVLIFCIAVPLLYISNDVFQYVWTLTIMMLGTFTFSTYRIYHDSRKQLPQEEEVLHVSDNGLVFVRAARAHLPSSLAESAWSALLWTLYGYALIFGAIFLGTIFSDL